MKKTLGLTQIFVVTALLALPMLGAQGGFKLVTGKAFDSGLPRDFYLEGNAIPVEKRNAALVTTAEGKRVFFGLLDTSGYSSQVQEKYSGMIISEGRFSLCGIPVGVGSYGFGIKKGPGEGKAMFYLYNQAGARVGACSVTSDEKLKSPTPLQVTVPPQPAALYLGRYRLALR